MNRWHAAWAERDRLLRIAGARTTSAEDAEDVVAEAIRRAGTSDVPVEALPAWLTRVTVNLCVDRHRRRATQLALLRRPELHAGDAPSHEDDVVDRDEARWLAGRLDSLPARQAAVLRQRAAGLDTQAIASSLGLSVDAVEGLLKRGRAVLRAALQATSVWLGALAVRRSTARTAAVAVACVTLVTVLLPHQQAPGPEGGTPATAGPADVSRLTELSPSTTAVVSASRERAVTGPSSTQRGPTAPAWDGPPCVLPVCAPLVEDEIERTTGSPVPKGWSPDDLHRYFGEPSWVPAADRRAPVVAVLGVLDLPWVRDDLATYRRTFGLPPCATDCLRTDTFASQQPRAERGLEVADQLPEVLTPRLTGRNEGGSWGADQSRLLQGVSASCPECRLLLVTSPTTYDLDMAEALRRATRSADVVVTAYDLPVSGDRAFGDSTLYGPAPVVTAGGVGGPTDDLSFPRVRQEAINVGGTASVLGHAWAVPDAAAFCDDRGAAAPWQAGARTGCRGRAGMDLAAPGGLGMQLAVYIRAGLPDRLGWYHPGRSTQAAAIVAGLLARHGAYQVVHGAQDLYAHPEWFADVVHGAGVPSSVTSSACLRLTCAARPGWDSPTGLGEPHHLPWF